MGTVKRRVFLRSWEGGLRLGGVVLNNAVIVGKQHRTLSKDQRIHTAVNSSVNYEPVNNVPVLDYQL